MVKTEAFVQWPPLKARHRNRGYTNHVSCREMAGLDPSFSRICNLHQFLVSWMFRRKMYSYLHLAFAIQFIVVERFLGYRSTSFVYVFHERNVLLCRNHPHFVEIFESGRRGKWQLKLIVETHCENKFIRTSFVISTGRFCRKRILLGGKYSSGIWTKGRLGPGATGSG
jgi:hypothetical protein